MHFSAVIVFSYSQFMVFDEQAIPGFLWTDQHYRQGFAKLDDSVSFRALLEFGGARVSVYVSAFTAKPSHERVIAVPFEVTSGRVVICGPEEHPYENVTQLDRGHYRLVFAQSVLNFDYELVDVYFERSATRIDRSEILLADDELDPPTVLLETAESAGSGNG